MPYYKPDSRKNPGKYPNTRGTFKDLPGHMDQTVAQGIEDAGEIVSLLVKDGILTEDRVRYAMRVKEKLATEKNLIVL